MRARSPILTSLCMILLMIDSCLNTWIFSKDPQQANSDALICLISIWATMCIQVPVLHILYLRVYRLKRVFELYENYLKT